MDCTAASATATFPPGDDPDMIDPSRCSCPVRRRLLDVQAKRRILDAYDDDEDRVRFGDWESCSDSCPGQVIREITKLLALPHADRPGYREEWKP